MISSDKRCRFRGALRAKESFFEGEALLVQKALKLPESPLEKVY